MPTQVPPSITVPIFGLELSSLWVPLPQSPCPPLLTFPLTLKCAMLTKRRMCDLRFGGLRFMQLHTISTKKMSIIASIMLGLTNTKSLTITITIKNACTLVLFPFNSFSIKMLCQAPSPCAGVVLGSLPTCHLNFPNG